MSVRLTHQQVVARCLEHGYQWPQGVVFEGALKKYPLICLTCGDNRPKYFHNVVQSGCRNCYDVASSLTHDEVVARGLAAPHPAELLEPYKGRSKAKHLYRFLDCGHDSEITPHNLVHNGQSCGVCYFNHGLTYLYLMEHQGLDAYKIGVTAVEHGQRWNSRIDEHMRRGWTLVHKVEFATRNEALALEKTIVDSWRDQGFPPGVTKEQMLKGYGETVSRELATAKTIKEIMRSNCYPGESWNTTSKVSMMAAAANCV